MPMSRGEKRKEQAAGKKKAKREEASQDVAESTERFMNLLENPRETEADIVLIDLAKMR